MLYAEVRSGQKFALLVRTAVNDIVDEVSPYAAVVEQRVALGGRAITHDALTTPASPHQELEESMFHVLRAGLEFLVGLWRMQASIALGPTHALERVAGSVPCLGVADIEAQGAAVSTQLLDIEYSQSVARHKPLDYQQREIRKVRSEEHT